MSSSRFPSRIHEVTAEWLTDRLRADGAIGSTSVTRFDSEPIGQGVGLMCFLHRITPIYDGDAPDAPTSLVLKTPVDQQQTRDVARLFQFYMKEVAFYRTAATLTPLAAPRCLAAEHDAETDEFVLLLEDLSAADTFSQVEGCPPEMAEVAIAALARHHAAFWQDDAFETDLAWVPYGWAPPILEALQQGVAASTAVFLDGFGDRFDDSIRRLCERFAEVTNELMYFGDRPLTFVHGDYHVGNMFFRDGQVVAFDWQFPMRTVGAYDLGYFLSQNLTVADRRASEEHLIELYRATLADAGVDCPLGPLMHDYRRVLLICLMPQILAGGGMELVNEQAVRLVEERLDRVVAAIQDHDAGVLMP